MNLLLLEKTEIVHHKAIELTGPRAEHIIKVLGCKAGDRIRAGIVDGPSGQAVITSISAGRVWVALDLQQPALPPPPVDLILALPRPIMLRRILATAAAMGVGRIFLVNARRVEKSFFSARMVKNRLFRQYLVQGLEQAMATRLPDVTVHPRFRPFVEDDFAPLAAGYDGLFLAHPMPQDNFRAFLQKPPCKRAVLAIGPEGGWIDYEVERLTGMGFSLVSCGPRILRVDTAVAALLSRVGMLLQ